MQQQVLVPPDYARHQASTTKAAVLPFTGVLPRAEQPRTVTRQVMLATPAPQCQQHSFLHHDAAALVPLGHVATYTPQLQQYQQLLLQQIQQLQQQVASQRANPQSATPPYCLAATAGRSAVPPGKRGQQHQQNGGQGGLQNSPFCQHAATVLVRGQHASNPQHSQLASDIEQPEPCGLVRQEASQQQQYTLQQQQQQRVANSSSCLNIPKQVYWANDSSICSRNITPLCSHHWPSSPVVSRALFGSPQAIGPQLDSSKDRDGSCTPNMVYTSSSTTSAAAMVASACSDIGNSCGVHVAAADRCHQQQESLGTTVDSGDCADQTCRGNDDLPPTPEYCTAACRHSTGTSSSVRSGDAVGTPNTGPNAVQFVPAAATPAVAACSIIDASPARVQCLVEQLEQRLSTLQNLLHSPAVMDHSPQQLDAQRQQQQQEAAVTLPAGPGLAPLLTYAQAAVSNSTSAEAAAAAVQGQSADSNSSSGGSPGGLNAHHHSMTEPSPVGLAPAQTGKTQHDAAKSSRQPMSPATATEHVNQASSKAAMHAAQPEHSEGGSAIGSRDADTGTGGSSRQRSCWASAAESPSMLRQQHTESDGNKQEPLGTADYQHQGVASKQQHNAQQVHQRESLQAVHQSKGRHLDLSRGGAALMKANACSDKLMFALLLASKKPVGC